MWFMLRLMGLLGLDNSFRCRERKEVFSWIEAFFLGFIAAASSLPSLKYVCSVNEGKENDESRDGGCLGCDC